MKNEFDVTGAAGTDISTATWIIGLATALVLGIAIGSVTADASTPETVCECPAATTGSPG